MIDPVKETEASIDAIRGGVTTLSEEIRARGKNPDTVLKEWSEDAEKIDELGLALECDPRKVNRGGSLQDDPDEPNNGGE
jgi:capsid protein